MAFPWLFEEDFGLGTRGNFDSETDTESRLDIVHYTDLAAVPGLGMPFVGAYCMRVALANDGSPADCYLQEDSGFDAAASATTHIRFMLWLSSDITMADADEFIILALQSAGPVNEGVIVLNYTTANGLRIGVGETAGSQFLGISPGWHCVELAYVVDSGVGNDGTLTLRLDGAAATAVSTLDQAAIAQARIGSMGQDAGTTKGWLLFDNIVVDDARIFPPTNRFPDTRLLTKSGTAFIGPGYIDRLELLSGGATDNTVSVFDTDTAYTSDASNILLEVKNTVASEWVPSVFDPVMARRGVYLTLGGTNPRVIIRGRFPNSMSPGAMKSYAQLRKPGPQGA